MPEVRNPEGANDFIYVDDVARGILALAQATLESGIYNLGGGQPMAIGEIVNMIASHYGLGQVYKNIRRQDGFWSDNAKTLAAVGWQVQTPLSDGIAQTLRALDEKKIDG